MRYNLKKGFPEEDEVIYGTVVDINNRVVVVRLDEFSDNLTGFLYPHEVAPGRIRNIRDYVKEGKRIVCVVLDSDKKTQRINLSLRRVSKKIKDKKLDQVKKSKIVDNIVENLSKQFDKDPEKIYDDLLDSFPKEIPSLEVAFQDYVDNKLKLTDYITDEKLIEPLENAIEGRFKPKRVTIKFHIKSITSLSSGLNLIKDSFSEIKKMNCVVIYLGGGKYEIRIERKDYKTAEKVFDKIKDYLEENLEPKSEEFNIMRV